MSDQPQTETKPPEPKPKSLVSKLAEVMAAVSYLQKTGTNSKQNYKYAREADVVAAIRPELAKRNIFIFPNVIDVKRTKIERLDFDKSLKFSWATDVLVEWTFVDGDSGEERKCIIPGCSESPGDKGVYVCMTGSEKYLLMKSFLLPTGDDPESDDNEEKGSKEAAQAVAKRKIKEHEEKGQQAHVPALFWTWYTESQTARIEGPKALLEANRDLLAKLWDGNVHAVVADANQLEDLKYQFEQRNVPFKMLKEIGDNSLEGQLKASIAQVKKTSPAK